MEILFGILKDGGPYVLASVIAFFYWQKTLDATRERDERLDVQKKYDDLQEATRTLSGKVVDSFEMMIKVMNRDNGHNRNGANAKHDGRPGGPQ